MALRTLPAAEASLTSAPRAAAATPFRTAYEECWLYGAPEDNPAALIVNPEATPAALQAAARARAESLAVLLDALESADQSGQDLSQVGVFTPLAALADEVRLLLNASQTARGRHV